MRRICTIIASVGLASFASPVTAIILHSDSEGASTQLHEAAPFQQPVFRSKWTSVEKFPYWDHVGQVGMGSGIYLGEGWVLTSAHVGCHPFRMGDGSVYKPLYNTWRPLRNPEGGASDMAVFQVQIATSSSLRRLSVMVVGEVDRGSAVPLVVLGTGFVEKGPVGAGKNPTVRLGYETQAVRRKRWAVVNLEKGVSKCAPTAGGRRTWSFASTFRRDYLQGQAAEGDSGGAGFAYDPVHRTWKLVGCVFAVSQLGTYVPFGARTYMADLSRYRAQLAPTLGDVRLAKAN